MTTATLIWQPKQTELEADIAATLAMDRAAWEATGARFVPVDDGDGEFPGFAVGTVGDTWFAVLAYPGQSTTFLLVPGRGAARADRTVDVVRELLAARVLADPSVVSEVLGRAGCPSDFVNRAAPAEGRGMNKTQLIDAIARDSGLSRADASRALESLLTTVTKTLKKGDEVAITGFGKFSVAKRGARRGRNPQTGEPVKIKASKNAKFTVGAALKNAVASARASKK
jgi:DNA-binding protein HU-beta